MNYNPSMIQTKNEKRAALKMASRKAQELFEILAAIHTATTEHKDIADMAWDLIDEIEDRL